MTQRNGPLAITLDAVDGCYGAPQTPMYLNTETSRCCGANTHRQKIVDTTMVVDIVTFGQFPTVGLQAVSDDQDMLPGVMVAAIQRGKAIGRSARDDIVWQRPCRLAGRYDNVIGTLATIL
jgi:hypothetical protein